VFCSASTNPNTHTHTFSHTQQGDFNFQPAGAQYKLMTEGSIPESDPHYPPLPKTDPWTPRIEQPLRSALALKFGKEPEFTCHSYADRVCA
jgi:hypothetical protein